MRRGGGYVFDTGAGAVITLEDTGGVNSVSAKTAFITVGTGQDTVAAGLESRVTVGASDTGATTITTGDRSSIVLAGGNSAAVSVSPGADNTITLSSAVGSGGVTVNLSAADSVGLGINLPGLTYTDPYGLDGITLTTLSSAGGFAGVSVKFVAGVTGIDHVTGLVDVSGQATFSQAVAHAVQLSAGGAATVKGDAYFSWFAFQGATYIVEHMGGGSATDALAKGDQVVGLTGTVDLTGLALSSSTPHLLLL